MKLIGQLVQMAPKCDHHNADPNIELHTKSETDKTDSFNVQYLLRIYYSSIWDAIALFRPPHYLHFALKQYWRSEIRLRYQALEKLTTWQCKYLTRIQNVYGAHYFPVF